MADYKLSKFNKIVPQLDEGEQIVAGAFGMPTGGVGRVLGGAAFGVVGAAVAGAGKATSGDVELPRRFVLGLTNRRLLFCKPDSFLGNPKSILISVPLTDLATAGPGNTGKLSKQYVFTTRSGQEIIIEAQKGKTVGWMDSLVTRTQSLLTG